MTDTTIVQPNGTEINPRAVLEGDNDWPAFAPVWAVDAAFEPSGRVVTFAREWAIPSAYRDAAPLLVLRVEQEFTRSDGTQPFVAGETRIVAGRALWADYRREEVASTLRAIADALAPQAAPADAASETGE